jgi:hypothetical protein
LPFSNLARTTSDSFVSKKVLLLSPKACDDDDDECDDDNSNFGVLVVIENAFAEAPLSFSS